MATPMATPNDIAAAAERVRRVSQIRAEGYTTTNAAHAVYGPKDEREHSYDDDRLLLASDYQRLAEQVRTLRAACRKADVLLTSFAVARNFTEHQKDAAVEVLTEVVAAIAATATK